MSGKRVLKSEEIFICDDLPREWVSTPEWRPSDCNGDECGLYVSTLDAVEKEKWEDEITNAKGERDVSKVGMLMASALARACVDEAGGRVFTSDQAIQLSKKSGSVMARLWQTFKKLNVVTDADVSDLVKN